MFCRNCGKEIPNDTKFCNHCGAPQDNISAQNNPSPAQNSHPRQQAPQPQYTYTAPQSQKKSGGKKAIAIIVSLAVVVVAFVIGYFATGANKLKRPTAFDTPDTFTFDELPSPSIKEDAAQDNAAGGETPAAQQKTFAIYNDFGFSQVTFYYMDDGVVGMIRGSISVDDTSAMSIDDLKSDAEIANDILTEMGADDASYISIIDEPENYSYRENYMFSNLDQDTDMAELAAAFIGFEPKNGKITIDQAEEAMLNFGYTEQ